MGALFVVFIAPTHFLGDAYILIKNLEKATGVYFNLNETEVFKWSEIGVSKFMILVRSLAGSPITMLSCLFKLFRFYPGW